MAHKWLISYLPGSSAHPNTGRGWEVVGVTEGLMHLPCHVTLSHNLPLRQILEAPDATLTEHRTHMGTLSP